MLTHTFIFTTDVSDPDNEKVEHTYSWGNKNNPNGWSKDQPEDISAANEALKNPDGLNKIGGEELDPYVEEVYNCETNPRNRHRWWPWNQCKTEADKLLRKAQKALENAQNGIMP